MSKEYLLSSERNFSLLREKIIPKYQKQEGRVYMKTPEFPKIIAHRGHLTDSLENSVDSIKKVLKFAPDYIVSVRKFLSVIISVVYV